MSVACGTPSLTEERRGGVFLSHGPYKSRGTGCPLARQMARNPRGSAVRLLPRGGVLPCAIVRSGGVPWEVSAEPWAHRSWSLIVTVAPASQPHTGSCLISKADPPASMVSLSTAILKLVGVISVVYSQETWSIPKPWPHFHPEVVDFYVSRLVQICP